MLKLVEQGGTKHVSCSVQSQKSQKKSEETSANIPSSWGSVFIHGFFPGHSSSSS
uniref:Uncharacterized protein n=1 Tax=Anguilla anguilla TaxID=7936 RepID=A0A0E9T864_ANGAN